MGVGCFVFWKSRYYWYSSLETVLFCCFRNGQKKWIILKRLVHLYFCFVMNVGLFGGAWKMVSPVYWLLYHLLEAGYWIIKHWLEKLLSSPLLVGMPSHYTWTYVLFTPLLPLSAYLNTDRPCVRRAPLPAGFWLSFTSGEHEKKTLCGRRVCSGCLFPQPSPYGIPSGSGIHGQRSQLQSDLWFILLT